MHANTGGRHDADSVLTIAALFLQSGTELGQIARSSVGIELSADEPIPSRRYGIQRSRQHKHKGAVGHSGEATTLQGAAADAFEGEHAEQFAESIDGFVEQRCHSFGSAIAAGQTGTATGDHHINRWIGDPAAQLSADLVAIIGAELSLMQAMPGGFKAALQLISAAVLGQGACVGDGEQGDGQAHGTAAEPSDARTAPAAMDVVLKVLLFASLRERAGWAERSLPFTPGVSTAREVWNQLDLGPLEGISIAVNQELVGADQPLQAGDELAFLPPFTGG